VNTLLQRNVFIVAGIAAVMLVSSHSYSQVLTVAQDGTVSGNVKRPTFPTGALTFTMTSDQKTAIKKMLLAKVQRALDNIADTSLRCIDCMLLCGMTLTLLKTLKNLVSI